LLVIHLVDERRHHPDLWLLAIVLDASLLDIPGLAFFPLLRALSPFVSLELGNLGLNAQFLLCVLFLLNLRAVGLSHFLSNEIRRLVLFKLPGMYALFQTS